MYLIVNVVDGKKYVGQTKDLDFRWKTHLRSSRYTKNSERRPSVLAYAISKHGVENFEFIPIVECSSQEELDSFERFLISELNTRVPNGYNISEGGNKGICNPWDHEAKEKLRLKRVGQNNPMYGKVTSEFTKRLLSESTKNSWTDERRKANSERMTRIWEEKRRTKNGI